MNTDGVEGLAGFFCTFDWTKKLKTRFFSIKLDFSAISHKFYILRWILVKILSEVTLFMPFLVTKSLKKVKNPQFLIKNPFKM